MSCCDDPTEAQKIDPRDLRREQEHYGNLLRDLFTGDPEKVMLQQLREASTYLRELAALRAHYDSVRISAIKLLDQSSLSVLTRIAEQAPNSEAGCGARKRLAELQINAK